MTASNAVNHSGIFAALADLQSRLLFGRYFSLGTLLVTLVIASHRSRLNDHRYDAATPTS
jgi:hypothetical protein